MDKLLPRALQLDAPSSLLSVFHKIILLTVGVYLQEILVNKWWYCACRYRAAVCDIGHR